MTSAQRVLASLPSCTSYPFPALNSLVIWNFRRDFFSLFSVILEEGSSGWQWQRGPSRITHLPVFSQHPAVVLAMYLTPHHATSPAPPAQQQGHVWLSCCRGTRSLHTSSSPWGGGSRTEPSGGPGAWTLFLWDQGTTKRGEELKDDFQSQK